MIEDCSPKAVLIYEAGELEEKIRQSFPELPVINLADKSVWEGKDDKLGGEVKPENLIYCIYTSGTTGKPKGVLIENRALINYLKTYIEKFLNVEGDVPLFTNYAFDLTVSSIWGSLLSGKKLVIFSEGEEVMRYASMTTLSVVKVTPTHMMMLLEERKNYVSCNIRRVLLGGESVTLGVLEKIYKAIGDTVEVINEYGPTEGTVACTYAFLNATDRITIGKPFYNDRIYIMCGKKLCGIGIPGELCIAGDGVARGYLNRPELTAEKFTDNPFGEGKLYHTGDLARWLPDGNIEYLGRIDEQVKIRGFRIELGEIESRIREIEGVKDCAVIAKADASGDKAIHAYLVREEENAEAVEAIENKEKAEAFFLAGIREKLVENLPDYMIPPYMMLIDRVPLTKNGKLDRRALPEIHVKTRTEYVAPRNATEEMICRSFMEILEVEKTGIKDNFFELGGHSMKAAKLVNLIEKETGKKIALKDVYTNPTPEKLADFVNWQAQEVKEEQKEVKILKACPIVFPPIEAYQGASFVLAALLSYKNTENVIYNNYINWHIKDTDNIRDAVLAFDHELWTDYDEADLVEEDLYYTKNMVREKFVDFVRERIDQKCYVCLYYLDEFYLSYSPAYRKVHHIHDAYIYGYTENGFMVMAYKDMKLQMFEVDNREITDSVFELEPEYAKNFISMRVRRKCEVKVSYELIRDEIQAYYDEKKEYDDDQIHGIGIYAVIEKCLKACEKTEQQTGIDLRIFRMIWEHKKLMVQRIRKIAEKYDMSEVLPLYEKLELDAEKLFRSAVSYYTEASSDKLNDVIREVAEIAEEDKRCGKKMLEEWRI